jgi:uncharacterized protein YkwD
MRQHQPFRRLAAVLAATAALSGAATLVPTPAAAFTTTSNGVRLNAVEYRLVSLINKARTSRGLRALTVAPGTTDLARDWSMNQARRNLLYHNPSLVAGVESHGSRDWGRVAENVGRGWGADSLFNAYMNSPGHRANILDSGMRYIGMGWVERPDGSGYNTQVFVNQYSTTYGRNRRPAVGGLADTRTPSATMSVGGFEGGWDPRVIIARSGSGVGVAGPVFDQPDDGDQGVRFRVYDQVGITSSWGEMRIRDALDLRHASGLRLRLSATTGSGRPITVAVNARRELGTSVRLGSVTIPSGETVTVTLPVPSDARNFRNVLGVAISSGALNDLSGTLSRRTATVKVRDVVVVV